MMEDPGSQSWFFVLMDKAWIVVCAAVAIAYRALEKRDLELANQMVASDLAVERKMADLTGVLDRKSEGLQKRYDEVNEKLHAIDKTSEVIAMQMKRLVSHMDSEGRTRADMNSAILAEFRAMRQERGTRKDER